MVYIFIKIEDKNGNLMTPIKLYFLTRFMTRPNLDLKHLQTAHLERGLNLAV